MSDSYVQVATDGAGKKIDNTSLTREKPDPAWSATEGDTVYRQRVVVSSDENPSLQARVSGEAGKGALNIDSKRLGNIEATLVEIRDMLRLMLNT